MKQVFLKIYLFWSNYENLKPSYLKIYINNDCTSVHHVDLLPIQELTTVKNATLTGLQKYNVYVH